MVDYSKWDRIDFGDSDSDSDRDRTGPRVTSLDRPGRVTIGPDGSLEIGNSNSPTKSPAPPQPFTQGVPDVSNSAEVDVVDSSTSETSRRSDESGENLQSPARRWREELTRNGGEQRCNVTINQKKIQLPFYWSQDRYTVTIRVGISPALFPTRGIRACVKGALEYADRFSAVGSGAISSDNAGSSADDGASYGSVEIISLSNKSQEETILLSGKLPRPIHLNQDEDEIDFEIEDFLLDGGGSNEKHKCTKLVTVVMPKAVPMEGMFFWWDCPLLGYPPIDISAIQERNSNGGVRRMGMGSTARNKDEKTESFQKAWNEAHEMFRKKMKTKEK